jgi:hypothetical protein
VMTVSSPAAALGGGGFAFLGRLQAFEVEE